MALTLLRHTTPQVAKGTCYGITDLALADGFEAEIAAILATLPGATCVVTSPLYRCRVLAERAAHHAGLELRVETHWQEMDFGRWEGVRWDDIPRPDLDAWAADFMGYDGHGGESVARLAARVEAGLQAVPDGALVVTHMGCIKAALALRGLGDGWNASLGFGGMTTL